MRFYEHIQTAGNGGSPAPNGAGFGHGEPLLVVSKRDLAELAFTLLTKPSSRKAKKELKELAELGNDFVVPLKAL